MQRIVVVVIVAVSELIGIAAVHDDNGFGHEAIVEPGNGRGAVDPRNREGDDRGISVPGHRRFADRRGTLLKQPAGIAPHSPQRDSGACQCCLGCAVWAGPETNHAFFEGIRRRRGHPFACHQTGARNVFVPRVLAADDLDVGIRLTIRQRALNLRAVAGLLVSWR